MTRIASRVLISTARLLVDRMRRRDRPVKLRRILLTRVQHLGDCVVFLPTIARVKQALTECELHVLAGSDVGEALFGMCPAVDKVIRTKSPGCKTRKDQLEEVEKIAAGRYDVALLSTEETGAAVKMFVSGVPCRIGFDEVTHMSNTHRERAVFLLSKVLKQIPGQHEVLVNLQLAEAIGCKGQAISFPLSPPTEAILQAEEVIESSGLRVGGFICVHVGTKQAVKRWALDNFAVACDIAASVGLQIAFVGAQNESELVEYVRSRMTQPSVNIAGKTSVQALASLMKHAAGFLGNDSGPMHLAAACNIPVTAIFVASDPDVWGPWIDHSCKRIFTLDDAEPVLVGKSLVEICGKDARPSLAS